MRKEQVFNSLSHRAPVYICHECGDEEGLLDAGYRALDLAEMRREKDFVLWCKLTFPHTHTKAVKK